MVEQRGVESVSGLSPHVCAKPRKETIGQWLCDSLTSMQRVCDGFQKLQMDADQQRTELIESQRQVIALQSELLACKNEQLQSLQSSVQTSVQETMKAEFDT